MWGDLCQAQCFHVCESILSVPFNRVISVSHWKSHWGKPYFVSRTQKWVQWKWWGNLKAMPAVPPRGKTRNRWSEVSKSAQKTQYFSLGIFPWCPADALLSMLPWNFFPLWYIKAVLYWQCKINLLTSFSLAFVFVWWEHHGFLVLGAFSSMILLPGQAQVQSSLSPENDHFLDKILIAT